MKKIKFFIPSIITLIILCIFFNFYELYPFGNNSIVQVDADYQFIPVLYRIYDFLHGNGSIIYDDIGLGNNIYISMIIQGSIFSPLSLLLYFTSRENIVNYFNIIVIIKMCLISLTTYIYINKSFKIDECKKILFSVLYGFSGWVLLNYFNIMWLDSVILFPLIMMFLNELLKNNKYIGYIITLSLSLMINYYISYFILLFILFYSFLYIFLKLEKEVIKKTIFRLGLATFISILISSVSLMPALFQTLLSSRIDTDNNALLFDNIMNKSLYLMLSSVFIVYFISLIFKYKKDKKNIYIYFVLFFLFGIGLFVEPINLGIHMGSYWSFPYRYSFVTLFILMNGGLYIVSNHNIKGYKKYEIIRLIIFILVSGIVIYLNSIFCESIINSRILLDFKDSDVYVNIVIIFLLLVLLVFMSLFFHNKKLKYGSFVFACLLQIFISSSWTLYYNDGYFLSKNANNVNNNMNIIINDIGRYKMGYYNYPPDYGFIYNVNTLDNWLHILPSNQIDIYKRLGYRNTDTCIRSYGGTIFTDWLFNVKYLIDDNYYHDLNIYKLLDEMENYYLYEYEYNSGFGVVYNKNYDDDIYKDIDNFYLHNLMYKELFDSNKDIVTIKEYGNLVIDGIVNIELEIDEEGFLYLYLPYETSYIKVNNTAINYKYFEYIIDLGLYNDDVTIEIGGIDNVEYSQFTVGFIKYDDIMNLNSNVNSVIKVNNGYDIVVNNKLENGYLFLPINNISGLKAYVNDNLVDIESYLANFVSIKLDKGDNKIEIRYEMPLLKIGIIFSLVGIILLLLFNKIPDNKIILNISYYLFIIICIVFYLYFYGYSLFKYYRF